MPEHKTLAATGNSVVAEAMRQCHPNVMAAYPITPQTTIVEEFAGFVAKGKTDCEYVTVESEHSAMSACIGASAAGARVMTATSSQGLALMWEELHIAAGMRLPIVMANANRALSAPINIHCDHSDIMGARDTGWVTYFAETAQEAYDNTIMAVRVAEHPDVMLPTMTTLDGFITTHSIDRVSVMDDATVAGFVGEYHPKNALLDIESPVLHGAFAGLGGPFFEFKKQQRVAMENARQVIKDVAAEYSALSGRPFDVVETWGMEDAEVAVVVIGSTAGNVRHVARDLRAKGQKVGVVKIRVWRPFPYAELAAALKGLKAVAVLDRAESFGAEGGPARGLDLDAPLGRGLDRQRAVHHAVDAALDRVQQAHARMGAILSTSKFVRQAIQVATMALGVYLVIHDNLSPGIMIAATILLGRALAPVESLIGSWNGLVAARSAFERLARLFPDLFDETRRQPLPAPEGRIQIERAYLAGPSQNHPILRQVDLDLPAGKSLAILGPSGSGKSSLARLIVGIWQPTSGHVRIDGAELGHWDRSSLGRHLGYLPQDVELFPGTVAENIGRFDTTDAGAILAAAKAAHAYELILRLPEGFDTRLGEDGIQLSAGQAQRIGLARALYGKPRIVVLDEPNANLDAEGEQALLMALHSCKLEGTTLIMITHKPSLVTTMDYLLVMREGRVEVLGPRDEVLAKLAGQPPSQVAAIVRTGTGP